VYERKTEKFYDLIKAKVLFSKSSIGTQILLTSEANSLLVDAGDGTLRDLTANAFEFETLKGILITHEHADHTGGLFSLLHFMKHIPRSEPLFLVSPKPIMYLKRLLEKPLMYSDIPFEVRLIEAEEGDKIQLGPFAVAPFRAVHVDFESIGYSISDGESFRVVVSGDTSPSDRLRELVRGADLALLEATFEDGQEKYAEMYGHMTVSQARGIGSLARELLLIHQMPQDYFAKMNCAAIPEETPG
jgi:ribonuclease Z